MAAWVSLELIADTANAWRSTGPPSRTPLVHAPTSPSASESDMSTKKNAKTVQVHSSNNNKDTSTTTDDETKLHPIITSTTTTPPDNKNLKLSQSWSREGDKHRVEVIEGLRVVNDKMEQSQISLSQFEGVYPNNSGEGIGRAHLFAMECLANK